MLPMEIESQLRAAQAVLQRHLGGNLLAIHLFGSAIHGGLKPSSDIDLMVSVSRALSPTTRRGLMHELLSHSAWPGRPGSLRALEATVVVLGELVPWRYPPRREMQFGEWLREEISAGRYEPPMVDHDLAILVTKLRRHSVALCGPTAETLFEPVPVSDLRRSLADTIAQWNAPADWQGEERNVILALARIWYTARTGEIASKDEAAAWVAGQLPDGHRTILEQAANAYLGGARDTLADTPEEVARTIGFVRGEIARELTTRA